MKGAAIAELYVCVWCRDFLWACLVFEMEMDLLSDKNYSSEEIISQLIPNLYLEVGPPFFKRSDNQTQSKPITVIGSPTAS